MPIDPVSVWKSEFEKLPKVGTTVAEGMTNLANFVDARVTNKLGLGPPMIGSFTYTFNKAIFLAPLISLTPSPSNLTGMTALANAWQSAALASMLIVPPGAAVGAPAPPTTFSVAAAIVDPASVALAYSTLLQKLLAAKPVGEDPPFPTYFYDAFTALKYNVSGLNSVPPPAGPQPLSAANVPVL
jgi:hypothetical protein